MTNEAAIQNPYLEPLNALIGTWKTSGKHPYLPDEQLHGIVSFEWIENGAFLKMATTVDHPQIPDGISLFGSDNISQHLTMLYFDERKISRIYDVSVENNELKWWRDDPKFSQRFVITIGEDGDTMRGKGEMCRDGKAWEGDLELAYTRVR